MVIVGGGLYTKGGGTGFVYQDGRFIKSSAFTVENGLAGEKIRSLFEDSGNRLWVGSEYDGLAVIYGDKSIILDKAHGLSCDEVKIIREDSSGNMWIGTRSGVTRIMKGVIAYE
jgi:ligand-binding sensor domain-containing protein